MFFVGRIALTTGQIVFIILSVLPVMTREFVEDFTVFLQH
jgi:hypothetical protein